MKYILLFYFVFVCFQLSASQDVDVLIKRQDNADVSTLKGQIITNKSVYSNVEHKKFSLDNIPIEENCFVIKNVLLENDFLRENNAALIKEEIIGRCVGAIGINKIAAELQDYYIEAGYITTRIYIPSQDISTGSLRFIVDAGKIENIVIVNDDINSWILPFNKCDTLNIRHIEQGLENLQQVPGVDVKIDIEPGTKNGYSNVVIDTHRQKTWGAKATYSNWGDDVTGRYLASGTIYFFNRAKLGDMFYFSGTKSTTGKYENISSYYTFPIGYWNYSLFYRNSDSHQTIPLSLFMVDYIGKNEHWGAKAERTLYRDKNRKVSVSTEIIRRKSQSKIENEELLLQKRDMGNVKLGVSYREQFTDAYLNSTISWQRFLTLFGGELTPDMIYGDVSSVSQIWSLESIYMQQFSNHVNSVTLFIQYAPHELTLQDQMTVGNRWSVRGFENSYGLTGNSGSYIQNSHYYPVGILNANAYIGADIGLIKDDVVYGDEIIAGSAIGLQGNLAILGYDLSVTTPLKYPIDLDVNKININFSISYQM
ncbi:ShlB/FhaC/HecB family hemolysin secretion/activation protein [Aeromonas veronii]|uniref:ShlB/FhaC/HecB family hemolysin secretion/activation protein n=1 Tax=Aeromonas veronii TaxID=654 RepID=UPI0031FDB715